MSVVEEFQTFVQGGSKMRLGAELPDIHPVHGDYNMGEEYQEHLARYTS